MQRYFINTLTNIYDLEQLVKNGKVDPVFQAILRESNHIKRFTWFLLESNINFKRSPLGSGITAFCVDTKSKYFTEKAN